VPAWLALSRSVHHPRKNPTPGALTFSNLPFLGVAHIMPRHASLKPIGYSWPYLSCTRGGLFPVWQPCIGSLIQQWCLRPKHFWVSFLGAGIPSLVCPFLRFLSLVGVRVHGSTLKPMGCRRSYLARRIRHLVPIWDHPPRHH
jgi:hypothetical protein